jgi:hypothetical protein
MRWKIYDESVDMMKQRLGFFPDVFRWRGRCFRVETVERCWTVSRRGWRRLERRRFFQVRCAGNTFELFQDLESGAWHLRRASLARSAAATAWQVMPALRWKTEREASGGQQDGDWTALV